MEQTIINAVFAGLGAVLSFVLKIIWDGLRDLQRADIDLLNQIGSLKLNMSDSYIKKEDFDKMTAAMFSKLDRIENKLDGKADRKEWHT